MKEKLVAALNSLRAIADAVRDLGEVPSGHLYASISSVMSLADYEKAIGLLIRANLIAERGNVLVWTASTREQVAAAKAEHAAEQKQLAAEMRASRSAA